MPRSDDLHRILIIGSGPIIIGQACEFDYSGTQAAKALKADGYEVILVNSNPATIMTDPELAARTYVEPLSRAYLEEIIKRERPDALLSTVGGQTGLNLSVELAEAAFSRSTESSSSAPRSTPSRRPRIGCCSKMPCDRSDSRRRLRSW